VWLKWQSTYLAKAMPQVQTPVLAKNKKQNKLIKN
jgi:hypothetical protein